MDQYRKLSDMLKASPNDTMYVGEIVNVQGNVATVKIADIEYEDVRLKVTDDDLQDYLVVVPEDGSHVVVADMSGGAKRVLIVLAVETPKEIIWKKGTTNLKINAEGYEIERQGKNLGDVLSAFIDEVSKIIVVQGTSPNVPALTQIKLDLNTILT